MKLVIRIAGMVEIPENVQKTLDRMRLRRKYSAILLSENEENMKLLQTVRNFVAYGDITDEMLMKLIEKRAEGINGKKVDPEKAFDSVKKKGLEESGIKPFFRLKPPVKGIESKRHFGKGKGVLGDNKDSINKLLERML